MNSRKIIILERKRLKAIRKWDVPELNRLESEINLLKEEDTKEIDAIINNLKNEKT